MPDYQGFPRVCLGREISRGAGYVYPLKRDAWGVGPVKGNFVVSEVAGKVFVTIRGFRLDNEENVHMHDNIVEVTFTADNCSINRSDKSVFTRGR